MSQSDKIYCANCAHCMVVRMEDGEEKYRLRVRCEKGMWIKSSGEEKFYKFFTVARRIMDQCPHYEPLGEELPYIKNLKRELPLRDEVYQEKKGESEKPYSSLTG